jgi:transposase-like protein
MFPVAPKTRHEYRRHAPQRSPCPSCGTLARRKGILRRTVRGIAYGAILLIHVTTGEYRARCGCCKTFRTQVEGIAPKAKYTNQIREAVLDRLLDDHMSLERILAALRRDFLLELSTGFVYDCLRWQVAQCDHADYRAWTLRAFSGTLCIDEIHLGRYTLLLATDPLKDFPVAFALVDQNDQAHMGRFLGQLRDHGLHPRVVITDGSNLYPSLLARLWPNAEHQLCVFHVLKDIHAYVLAAVRQRQKSMLQPRGSRRRRGRGRPTKQQQAQRARVQSLEEKAAFVYKHRFLIVTRRDQLTPWQQRQLTTVLEYLPSLRPLRRFIDDVQHLLDAAQTAEQAQHRYERLMDNAAYLDDPALQPALKLLAPSLFAKTMAFLRSPVGQRQRTNNHVERMNRKLRHYEKVRYGWRRPRRLVQFVVLAIHRLWRERLAVPVLATPDPDGPVGRETQPPAPPGDLPWQRQGAGRRAAVA